MLKKIIPLAIAIIIINISAIATADYSIHTIVTKTNMWNSSTDQVFDLASIILVTGVFLIFIIAGLIAIIDHFKKKNA